MANLFITIQDQIIDLNHVIAIEMTRLSDDTCQVNYHLTAGVIIYSRCSTDETVSKEKWVAYQQMKPSGQIETNIDHD